MDRLDDGISVWEFVTLVGGLSTECRFWAAVQKEPKKVSTPDQIAALTGSYLGPGTTPTNPPQQNRRGVRR
mgnify:CR=1 FL=1